MTRRLTWKSVKLADRPFISQANKVNRLERLAPCFANATAVAVAILTSTNFRSAAGRRLLRASFSTHSSFQLMPSRRATFDHVPWMYESPSDGPRQMRVNGAHPAEAIPTAPVAESTHTSDTFNAETSDGGWRRRCGARRYGARKKEPRPQPTAGKSLRHCMQQTG